MTNSGSAQSPVLARATIAPGGNTGCNLVFTPGVYKLNQALNVTHADTTILGIGFPTLIPQNGVNTMQVADVNRVRCRRDGGCVLRDRVSVTPANVNRCSNRSIRR